MKFDISESVKFYTGLKKEDEEERYFHDTPLPMIRIHSASFSAVLTIENKKDYESFTEDLFWILVEQRKLKCPKCGKELDFDVDHGDTSVGMESYRMAGCVDDDCHFAMNEQTEEIEKELIRQVFPLYWKWNE